MTEREMLELAARAMGFDVKSDDSHSYPYIDVSKCNDGIYESWSPSHDIADCADMEARLMIDVNWTTCEALCFAWNKKHGRIVAKVVDAFANHNNDRQRARMMASTRAAAALAEGME